MLSLPEVTEKMLEIVNAQNALNEKINKDWIKLAQTGEWDYQMAAVMELAEFNKSVWVPWWSKMEIDWDNGRIEIVDALHFMVSVAIADAHTDDIESTLLNVAGEIAQACLDADDEPEVIEAVDVLDHAKMCMSYVLEEGSSTYERFSSLFDVCSAMHFKFEHLYGLYIGKSELNAFRQDKGYKAGTYKKIWHTANGVDRDDNHYMRLYIERMEEGVTRDMIRSFLENTYIAVQDGSMKDATQFALK